MRHIALTVVVAVAGIHSSLTETWAQDGNAGSSLFVMNADGKELLQLPSPGAYDGQGSPVWSPDGKKIGFDAWRASIGENYRQAHVFTAKADGSNPQDLGDGAMPSFSRDGSRITFSRYRPNRGVWTMNADGSDKTLLDANGWAARWSSDGRHIAYTTYRDGVNIVIYDVREKQRRRILNATHSERYRIIYWSFCWSPDNKQVCFKALRRSEDSYEVAIANVAGSDKGFQILIEGQTDNKFSWHPDGKKILLSKVDPTKKFRQLFSIQIDKPDSLRVVDGQPLDRVNAGPDWSPDGKKIIFASREIVKKR